MNRFYLIVCQLALLAIVGCSEPADTPVTEPSADTSSQAVPGSEATTFVSLKVPNMV